MKRNIDALRNSHVLAPQEVEELGHRAFDLFPTAAQRGSLQTRTEYQSAIDYISRA